MRTFLLAALHHPNVEFSSLHLFAFSIFTLTAFVLYLARSYAYSPVLDATSPAMGIAFCLIIVQGETGLIFRASAQTTVPVRCEILRSVLSAHRSDATDPGLAESNTRLDKAFCLQSLAVRITRDIDVHEDCPSPKDKPSVAETLANGLGRYDQTI